MQLTDKKQMDVKAQSGKASGIPQSYPFLLRHYES
jgi:hypothetical protein